MSTAARSSTVNKNYIGGTWLDGVSVVEDINPPNIRDVVGHFVQGDAAHVSAAVGSAKAAFPAWPRSNPGQTVLKDVDEVLRAAQIFLFFSGECVRLAGEKISSVRSGLEIEFTRESIGVVGLITPWRWWPLIEAANLGAE
jgi:alpha-ketoglutaric semialdehyde dehydrogenase